MMMMMMMMITELVCVILSRVVSKIQNVSYNNDVDELNDTAGLYSY
jgi:hypothetical protein